MPSRFPALAFALTVSTLLGACAPDVPVGPGDGEGPGGNGGGGQTPPVQRATLTAGTPVRDSVTRGEIRGYTAAVTPGVRYAVAVIGLTDGAATLRVSNGGAVSSDLQAGSPKSITVTAASGSLLVDVGAASVTAARASYVVMVVPAPVPPVAIVGTSGPVPAGVPTIGWVETRSTSRYRVDGLTGAHTISIVGLTDAAELKVYPDESYTMERDCTLKPHLVFECAGTGTSAYFTVTAGGVNRDGAGYVMLVW